MGNNTRKKKTPDYDNVFKTMKVKHKRLFISVINDIFGKEYPYDANVEVLPSEGYLTESDIEAAVKDLEYFRNELVRLYETKEISDDELMDLKGFVNTIITHITNGNKNEERLVNVMGGTVIETETERLRREGREEGREEEARLIVHRMFDRNRPVEEVSELTGQPMEYVDRLHEEYIQMVRETGTYQGAKR